MQKEKKVVAAFDFDGTLTHRDSLPYFLHYLVGTRRAIGKSMLALPALFGFAFGLQGRQQTKEAILKPFIKGIPFNDLQKSAQSFASGPLNKLLRHEAMQRLEWHQRHGHQCILISANLDVYLQPWAAEAGFDHLICSNLALDSQHAATGYLQQLNCWGQEKTRRLVEWLGNREEYILYAYGDSRGDRELLAFADYPFYRSFPRPVRTLDSV